MKEYKVGDKVWLARCGTSTVTKTCPICFGKLKVKLILGDDSEIDLPCDYCGKGFEGPVGTVEEYEYVAEPELHTITRVTEETTSTGVEYEYHDESQGYCQGLEASLIFITKEETADKCEEIKQAYEIEQAKSIKYLKKSKQKSFSWNAGYHLRCAKQERKSAEYHERMAIICKERSKP